MSDTGLLTALLAVQSEAPTLPKDGVNPHFRSKYTPLDTIVEKIGPILTAHGLVWSTLPCRDEHGDPALQYRLAHAETGEVLEGTMPLLLTKADPQGMGSAITYARRYSLCAVLNLVADEDDDGNAGSSGQAPARRMGGTAATDAQKRRIKKDFKGQSVASIKAIFTKAGVFGVEDVVAAVDGLLKHQASAVIDVLAQGALPDPEHPALDNDASEFTHPPTEGDAFGEPDDPADDPDPDLPGGQFDLDEARADAA